MTLDANIRPILDQLSGLPALETLSVAAAREFVTSMTAAAPPGPEVYGVEDRVLDLTEASLRVRIYRATDRPSCIMVYYHGGGWVLGSLDSADALLRAFAIQTQACIVSVDYRLAPEHPFPAAVVDAHAAFRWAVERAGELAGAPVPVLVAGDSAGGNLATIVAILSRDAGGAAPAAQLLFYPVTDCNFDTPSYLQNAEGMFLTRNLMRWFWDHYVRDQNERTGFRCSPLRAADLSGLPPALIQTAEYDPLRDEGEAYARRLEAQGTAVTLQRRDGLIHGYISMTGAVPAAAAAVSDAAAWVKGITTC